MSKTLENIIDLTLQELSQIPGHGTQVFSEDIVASKIQKMFNFVWKRIWWENYMSWLSGPLDGTNGVLTIDLSSVKGFEDVRVVFRSGSDRPLPVFPRNLNPGNITGNRATYIEALAKNDANALKVFRVLPVAATGTLYVHARLKPDDFTLTDEIHIDETLLAVGAAWDYIEGDGTSPSDAQRLQNQFEARLKQIESEYSSKPLTLSTPRVDVPDQWFSNP